MLDKTDAQIVYVRLLGEGTDVWRPAQASYMGGDRYQLIPQAVPDSEEWEFSPGTIVHCETRTLSGSQCTAAVQASNPVRTRRI